MSSPRFILRTVKAPPSPATVMRDFPPDPPEFVSALRCIFQHFFVSNMKLVTPSIVTHIQARDPPAILPFASWGHPLDTLISGPRALTILAFPNPRLCLFLLSCAFVAGPVLTNTAASSMATSFGLHHRPISAQPACVLPSPVPPVFILLLCFQPQPHFL